MRKPLQPCRQAGCPELVERGYCEKHQKKSESHIRNPFRLLDSRKDPRTVKFYNSRPWKRTSYLFRKKNPFCSRCATRGIDTPVELVHHDPDLIYLLDHKMNPLSYRYLHGLCNKCHLEDLRDKKWKSSKD